jgi:hypothetical protein
MYFSAYKYGPEPGEYRKNPEVLLDTTPVNLGINTHVRSSPPRLAEDFLIGPCFRDRIFPPLARAVHQWKGFYLWPMRLK